MDSQISEGVISVENNEPRNLGRVIETAVTEAPEPDVSVEDLVNSVGRTSLVPLLLLPSIALVSPLSGIPLFSATMGLLIVLISSQILLRRNHVWLPQRLLTLQTKSARMRRALHWVEPATVWLDERAQTRLTILARPPFVVIPQIMCLLSGLALPALEFVPFSSTLVGMAVALLALGMLARDGIILLIGCLPYVAVGWLIYTIL